MITGVQTKGEFIVVTINVKEASLTNSEAFKKEMHDYIDMNHKKVIVDFGTVQFLDSSFLGAMVSALKYAISKQSDISVVRLNNDIKYLFQLTRMDKVFKVYASIEEALLG